MNNNDKPKQSLSKKLEPQIKAYELTPEAVAKETLKIFSSTPALKKASPDSVMLSVALSMHLGLSTDKVAGEFAIIPYKDGMNTIAQTQIMYKGYKKLVEENAKDVLELKIVPIKNMDEDIKSFKNIPKMFEDELSLNGEFILNDIVWPTKMSELMIRREQKTVAYLALIMVKEETYGVKNIGCLMTVENINTWKNKYSPNKVLLTDYNYARKTIAKKVIRDAAPVLIQNKDSKLNRALTEDQGVQELNKEINYVETKELHND